MMGAGSNVLQRVSRRLSRLLKAPYYPDQQQHRTAVLANAVLWVSFLAPLAYLLVTLHLPAPWYDRAPLVVASAVPALGLWALRRGFLRGPSVVLVATFLIVTVWGASASGGVRAPSVVTLILGVVLAGQLLGVAAGLVTAAIAIGAVAFLTLAGVKGWLPAYGMQHTDWTYGGALMVELAAIGAFSALAARLVQHTLAQLHAEQQTARDAAQYMHEALEASPDAIVSLDPAGFITRANRALELLLGRSREQIIGRHFSNVATLSPDNEREAREAFAALLAGKKPVLSSSTLRRADGSEVTIEVNPRVAIRSDRSLTIEVVIRDVTDRLRAERRQRELQIQLDDARRMEYIGRLAGGVAHDFNNVLTIVLANAADGLDSLDVGEEDRERFQAIRDAGVRAARLTRQLLTFARRQDINPRLVALGQLLQEMRGFLAQVLPANIKLDMDVLANPIVRIDPGQLDQNPRQPGGQRSRCHAVRGPGDGAPDPEDLHQRRFAAPASRGSLRRPGSDRHRRRDGRGYPGQHLRSLLHHQTERPGDGPGPGDRPGHRPGEWRRGVRVVTARSRKHVRGLSAGGLRQALCAAPHALLAC